MAASESAAPPALGRARLTMATGRRGSSMPAPLRGSYESLVHQNEMAEAEGLDRIADDAELNSLIAEKALVAVPVSAALGVNPELPENRRYCRPWTARFLADLARAHRAQFSRSPLLVTSAVRTVDYQRHLQRVNGNAAAAEGDVASPHLTGGTIDIAKRGLSRQEIAWMRNWLGTLERSGRIDVEEEFRQACFHISVYKSYTSPGMTPGQPMTPLPEADEASNGVPTKGR